MIISLFTLSIIAGYSIKILSEGVGLKHRPTYHKIFIICIIVLILLDYHSFKPLGLTEFLDTTVYEKIKQNSDKELILEIPLWPGESHQSSLYELYITRDKLKRVNGYSPLVSEKYIEEIFNPLSRLNLGVIEAQQYDTLLNKKIKFITVHNNLDVFTQKVALNYFSDQTTYPPIWVPYKEYHPYYTVRRLMNSKYVRFLEKDRYKDIYLFEVNEYLKSDMKIFGIYNYPISIDAAYLPRRTGTVFFDKDISKNVVTGRLDKDNIDFLTYGPYWKVRKGKFIAVFKIKSDYILNADPVAQIQVSSPKLQNNNVISEDILVNKNIYGHEFKKPYYYQKFEIPFDIEHERIIEFRTKYLRQSDIWIDKIYLSTIEDEKEKYFFEAEKCLGTTGNLVYDHNASDGRMIYADNDTHKSGYLFVTPERSFAKGKYRGFIRMKIGKNNQNQQDNISDIIATFDIATNNYKDILFSKQFRFDDLSQSDLQDIYVDFEISRNDELSFRFWFNAQIETWVDSIKLVPIK